MSILFVWMFILLYMFVSIFDNAIWESMPNCNFLTRWITYNHVLQVCNSKDASWAVDCHMHVALTFRKESHSVLYRNLYQVYYPCPVINTIDAEDLISIVLYYWLQSHGNTSNDVSLRWIVDMDIPLVMWCNRKSTKFNVWSLLH